MISREAGVTEGNGTLLTIYNLKGKYIAFRDDFGKRVFNAQASKAIGEPIKHVLCLDPSELTIVTESDNVFTLKEIELSRKLELLYSKHLYTLAMNLILQPPTVIYNISKTRNLEELIESTLEGHDKVSKSTLMDTCKRFGDYLYSKSDYDSAVKQYIRSIGHTQPSYIIRKFLDAQRIQNLTEYLKALHSAGHANANHTTLLLNCYTKLNDPESLKLFVDTCDSFDVDNAIIVCRQAGLYQQALEIASKFDRHDWYLKIQLQDLELYDEAISYLVPLPADLFIKSIKKYGGILVTKRSLKMSELLAKYYIEQDQSEIAVSDIYSFFLNRPEWGCLFLEWVLKGKFGVDLFGQCPAWIPVGSQSIISTHGGGMEDFTYICDVFLDVQLSLRRASKSLPSSITNVESITTDWDSRILIFLKSDLVKYDLENALFLAQQYHFDEGLLVLFEKLDLYVSLYMATDYFVIDLASTLKKPKIFLVLWKHAKSMATKTLNCGSRGLSFVQGIARQTIQTTT